MASSRVRESSQKRKKDNSKEERLKDLVKQMQAFLDDKLRKRKKKAEYEFHHDLSTGLQKPRLPVSENRRGCLFINLSLITLLSFAFECYKYFLKFLACSAF